MQNFMSNLDRYGRLLQVHTSKFESPHSLIIFLPQVQLLTTILGLSAKEYPAKKAWFSSFRRMISHSNRICIQVHDAERSEHLVQCHKNSEAAQVCIIRCIPKPVKCISLLVMISQNLVPFKSTLYASCRRNDQLPLSASDLQRYVHLHSHDSLIEEVRSLYLLSSRVD